MKKIIFILTIFALITSSCGNVSSKKYTEELETIAENDTENYGEYEYVYEGLTEDELPADFLAFLKKFTSNRETQLSLIHKPFLLESYEEDDEYWNEEKLIEKWGFMNSDEFFFGLKKTDDGYFLAGTWKMNDNSVIYTLGEPESCGIGRLTFKKVNGSWYLFSSY